MMLSYSVGTERESGMETGGQGPVIWITGLSGAGKTTVGRVVHRMLEERGRATIFLDGDELRGLFPLGERFDRDSRLRLALGYGKLCRLLALQGYAVVCATISMRREVYAWNRDNLPGYVEVFLDIDEETRRQRDPKSYYALIEQGGIKDFAGSDQSVDWPEQPHLRLCPAPGETAEATAARIIAHLTETDSARQARR
jgi:cytidine diphosphoramidate kinase